MVFHCPSTRDIQQNSDIKQRGMEKGWMEVMKDGQRFLRGEDRQNDEMMKQKRNKQNITQQA